MVDDATVDGTFDAVLRVYEVAERYRKSFVFFWNGFMTVLQFLIVKVRLRKSTERDGFWSSISQVRTPKSLTSSQNNCPSVVANISPIKHSE